MYFYAMFFALGVGLAAGVALWWLMRLRTAVGRVGGVVNPPFLNDGPDPKLSERTAGPNGGSEDHAATDEDADIVHLVDPGSAGESATLPLDVIPVDAGNHPAAAADERS